MKKMKSLFKITWEGNNRGTAHNEVNEGCEWALTEGIPTRKRDGTACMVQDGILYKRFDAKIKKDGSRRSIPDGAVPCQDEPDPITGHFPHWVKIDPNNKSDWFYIEAWNLLKEPLCNGTYELCGKPIESNHENIDGYKFIRHGEEIITDLGERTFENIKKYIESHDIEGIVFHHPDGRMCKVKKVDFGIKWK